MKTTFDVNTYVYQLASQAIGTTLTGGVYKLERPRGSKVEDIVVSSLPITEGVGPQVATCNVNIHVPDIDIGIAEEPHKVANNARLKELADILITALDEGVSAAGDYTYRVTNQTVIEEPELGEHFFNLRLELRIY